MYRELVSITSAPHHGAHVPARKHRACPGLLSQFGRNEIRGSKRGLHIPDPFQIVIRHSTYRGPGRPPDRSDCDRCKKLSTDWLVSTHMPLLKTSELNPVHTQPIPGSTLWTRIVQACFLS